MYTPAGGPAKIFNFTIKPVIIIFFVICVELLWECVVFVHRHKNTVDKNRLLKAKYTWRSLVELTHTVNRICTGPNTCRASNPNSSRHLALFHYSPCNNYVFKFCALVFELLCSQVVCCGHNGTTRPKPIYPQIASGDIIMAKV